MPRFPRPLAPGTTRDTIRPATVIPSTSHTSPPRPAADPHQPITPGVVVAVLAGLHKMLHAAVLVNDDFMHRAYARQVLGGEVPIRDFFDYGMVLMYAVSAAAESVLGYRLLAEALVVGLAVGLSTYAVYDVARRTTGSTALAVLTALLLVVATPRSYGYVKLVVYATAAWFWWRYVWSPFLRRALLLGVVAGVAFYWRPDHGAYVAVGVALAMVAAHGVSALTVRRCLQSGAVALAIVVPWLAFASAQAGGLPRFVQSGITAATEEHRSTGQAVPRWPVRRPADVVRIDDRARYAPEIDIRWADDSPPDARQRLLAAYGLTVVTTRNEVSDVVRLSDLSRTRIRDLLAEPLVADTGGVERGLAQVDPSIWPALDRWRFNHWWLRVRVLPGLDAVTDAGEAAAVLLFALPVLTLLGSLLLRRHLPAPVSARSLGCFAVFAVLVDFGLLRTPFLVRVGDAVVLPGIGAAILAAALLNLTSQRRDWRRWMAVAAMALVAVLLAKSLAVAGQSTERVRWLAGDFTSITRARTAWAEVQGRLGSSPPIDFWRSRTPEASLQLALYARDCLPPTDRILALWFAPEIYYYSDRLMAGRHVFFLPPLGALPHERQAELDAIGRTPPQLVFTRPTSEREPREAFPEIFVLLDREYHLVGALETDERYLIYARNDRPATGAYGPDAWPCYVEQ